MFSYHAQNLRLPPCSQFFTGEQVQGLQYQFHC